MQVSRYNNFLEEKRKELGLEQLNNEERLKNLYIQSEVDYNNIIITIVLQVYFYSNLTVQIIRTMSCINCMPHSQYLLN